MLCSVGRAETVRVTNPFGNISIRSLMGGEKVEVRVSVPSRPRQPGDVKYTESPGMLEVQCQPSDGARIDVDISVPHTAALEVATKGGAIAVTGLIRRAALVTDSGDIRLVVPWDLRMMRLQFASVKAPRKLTAPQIATALPFRSRKDKGVWTLSNDSASPTFPPAPRPGGSLSSSQARQGPGSRSPLFYEAHSLGPPGTYGEITVKANTPGHVELLNMPMPADSWVKRPSPLFYVLPLLEKPARAKGRKPAAGAAQRGGASASAQAGTPLYVSNVRLVSLPASIYDREGRAVAGLMPEDFEVLEEGVPQKVSFAGSDELPFDLVLLLDLSGSTLESRELMMEAARRFVGIADPRDRVAIYALAGDLFQVLSPLTSDRERLTKLIQAMPAVAGGSTIDPAIVLAYAQESLHLSQTRAGLVVISDGLDSRVFPMFTPSPPSAANARLQFTRLVRAVAEWPVLIYPVLLPTPPEVSSLEQAARAHMQQLADASGGRLFPAKSLRELEPVYAQVAGELRSVYTISYYPRNQDFDGKWRRVQVRVRRPGLNLRTRDGYYAR